MEFFIVFALVASITAAIVTPVGILLKDAYTEERDRLEERPKVTSYFPEAQAELDTVKKN